MASPLASSGLGAPARMFSTLHWKFFVRTIRREIKIAHPVQLDNYNEILCEHFMV